MNHNHPNFIKYKEEQNVANPLILKVFEEMQRNGKLEGLSDDEALEKVVYVTEKLIKGCR